MARKSSASETIKKLPTSENGVKISVEDVNGKKFKISHSLKTRKFTLWEIVDEGFKQIATGSSTYDLYKFVDFGNATVLE